MPVQVLVLQETLEFQDSIWCCSKLPMPSPLASLQLFGGVQQLTPEQVALVQSCIPFEVVPSAAAAGEGAQLKYQRPLPNVSHR
jgi:hypothetical protein